jgi:ribosomal-protein-alanine N-acetyltransferase
MIVQYDKKYKDQIVNLGRQYDLNFESKYLIDIYKKYLYIDNQNVLGFLIIEETVDESNVILLYVDKNNRRKKIASYLMDYFISEIDNSKPRILLEVSENNNAAIYLYDKFGFKVINVRKKYYSDGSNALVMERMVLHE